MSGHPTLTTLGNTFRSILYICFYLEKAGIRNPWDVKVQRYYGFWFAVAGDDVVFWARPDLMSKFVSSAESLTSRTMTGCVGLG